VATATAVGSVKRGLVDYSKALGHGSPGIFTGQSFTSSTPGIVGNVTYSGTGSSNTYTLTAANSL
jgi:hypothetical protein